MKTFDQHITELSKNTLKSYVKKANKSANDLDADGASAEILGNQKKANKLLRKSAQRSSNIVRAHDKIDAKEKLGEEKKPVKQKDLNTVEYAPGEDALINKNSRKRKQDSVAGESYVPESTDHLDKHISAFSKGFDPSPKTWTGRTNHDTMTYRSDPVHHSSGVSAHIEQEHGGKTKVHFTHNKMSEMVESVEPPKVHTQPAGNGYHDVYIDDKHQSHMKISLGNRSNGNNQYGGKKYTLHVNGKPHSTGTLADLKSKITHSVHQSRLKKANMTEATKGERSMMAYVEKRAVKAAEKANVGKMSRPDKEAWIDQYIKDNAIPKGAVGSAVYSGVMKVRAKPVVKENNDFSHLSDEELQDRINKHKQARNKASGGVNSAAYLHHSNMVKHGSDELKKRISRSLGVKENMQPTASLVHKIARSMKSEETQLDEILSIQGRLKRARDIKKNKAKLAMGKHRQSMRIASKERLQDRAKRHARAALVARITKGIPKGELSMQRRAEIERRLERMKNVQTVIARKLLPQVRKDELLKKRSDKTTEKK